MVETRRKCLVSFKFSLNFRPWSGRKCQKLFSRQCVLTMCPLLLLQISALTLLGSSGEMVYFFFDHFTWMSRVGLLDSKLAGMSSPTGTATPVPVTIVPFATVLAYRD